MSLAEIQGVSGIRKAGAEGMHQSCLKASLLSLSKGVIDTLLANFNNEATECHRQSAI
jgi:hypothetical protein